MAENGWIGKILGGRYRIDELIGSGGMSSVYKALDPNLHRVVAIKMIHPHLSEDPKFILRFEEEARSVAQLRHPNIVQVYDFNLDGSNYYMVQEFMAGETLQARLARLQKAGRRMPLKELIRFAIDICNALYYAHQRGLIHRDVKPANIMLDTQGQAVLMDFGIVKITGGQKHTATGAVVGTALYMSPELIRGEPADPRSDIYSLGVTLFEMASGRPPFEAESAMTLMMMHLNDPLPDLRELRPEVPDELIAVIERAVAKDRAGRFASAADMAAALKKAQTVIEGATFSEATLLDSPAAPAGYEPGEETLVTPPSWKRPSQTLHPTPPEGSNVAFYNPNFPRQTPPPGQQFPATTPIPGTGPGYAQAYPPLAQAPSGRKTIPTVLAGAAVLVVVACLVAGGFLLGGWLRGNPNPLLAFNASATPTEQAALPIEAALLTETLPPTRVAESPTPTPEATEMVMEMSSVTPTATMEMAMDHSPTAVSTVDVLALPPVPTGQAFVRIRKIALGHDTRYVVDYETFQLEPGMRIRFFFNTVRSPDTEIPGKTFLPGRNPWILSEGISPFNGFAQGDRPAQASILCALVADTPSSVLPGSGTCQPLPDLPVLVASAESACLLTPNEGATIAAHLLVRDAVLIRGIVTNEQWWLVQNPDSPVDSCWARDKVSKAVGNLVEVPVVEAPADMGSSGSMEMQHVMISSIEINEKNEYVINFTRFGDFSSGVLHVHFFWNNIDPRTAGKPGEGPWIRYEGESPYMIPVSERPAEATQVCAIVANPDHTLHDETYHCMNLPES